MVSMECRYEKMSVVGTDQLESYAFGVSVVVAFLLLIPILSLVVFSIRCCIKVRRTAGKTPRVHYVVGEGMDRLFYACKY